MENKITDTEQTVLFLKQALEAIHIEEDIDEMNQLRALFRKTVPLSKRAYLAAYLIKQVRETKGFPKKHPHSPHTADARGNKPPRPRIVLDPETSTSLFISIGRKRRVYPKDIISLLIQTASIERSRIGDIRILDNYSFVQVMTEDADMIIEKLHNTPYRGRPLAVSYSRKQDDAPEHEHKNAGTQE